MLGREKISYVKRPRAKILWAMAWPKIYMESSHPENHSRPKRGEHPKEINIGLDYYSLEHTNENA